MSGICSTSDFQMSLGNAGAPSADAKVYQEEASSQGQKQSFAIQSCLPGDVMPNTDTTAAVQG